MLPKSAVRAIMEQKGIGTNALAKMIGKIPQTVSDRLNPEKGTNLSIDKMEELISAMGYKIVLMPENVKIKDGWYEVEYNRTNATGDPDQQKGE